MPQRTVLRQMVLERHWQVYETFRAEYEATAERLGRSVADPRLEEASISKRQFERWYAGRVQRRPLPHHCRVLETMFGMPVDELLGPSLAAADDQGHAEPALDQLRHVVARAAEDARDLIVLLGGSNVSQETLEELGGEVRHLAREYGRRPLSSLLADLVRLQDSVFRLLEGRQRPTETTDLMVLAGLVSGLLAKASHDGGDPRSAMTHARTGVLCASDAGHASLIKWLRGLQSLVAYWDSRPNEALQFVQDAAGKERGSVSVWLPALEARALGMLGRGAEAKDAIARAELAREHRLPDDLDDIGGVLTFSEPRQLYYAADAMVWLSESEPVERYALAALAQYETRDALLGEFTDEAGARADLSLARVRRGDFEGGAAALRPVLDLPPDRRIGGVIESTRRVSRELTRIHHGPSPLVVELQEEIEDFARTASIALVM